MEKDIKEKIKKLVDEKYENLTDTKRLEIGVNKKKEVIAINILAVIGLICLMVLGIVYYVKIKYIYGIPLAILCLIYTMFLIVKILSLNKTENSYFCKLALKAQAKTHVKKEDLFLPVEEELKEKNFVVTNKVIADNYKLLVDYENKKFVVVQEYKTFKGKIIKRYYSKIYKFSDLYRYEVYEDNNQVLSGTAGKSFVGGALFGTAGAIIGGNGRQTINEICREMSLVIYCNDLVTGYQTIRLINSSTPRGGVIYQNALSSVRSLCSALEYILNNK